MDTRQTNFMADNIRAVDFDLADVLLDFAGPESLARTSSGRIGPVEFSRLWSSPLANAPGIRIAF